MPAPAWVKGCEELHLGFHRNADAGIADLDAYLALPRAAANIHPSEAREFQGVGQQVADDLPHAGRVAQDLRRKLRVDQARQFDAGRGVL